VNGIFLAKRRGWIVRVGNGGCDAVSQYWISCWSVALVQQLAENLKAAS